MVDGRFTEEQMKAFSNEVVPVLERLFDIAKRNGLMGSIRIYSNGDGYVDVEGDGLQGWVLRKYKGEYEMAYNKVIPLEEVK